jgi:hypothetical protein
MKIIWIVLTLAFWSTATLSEEPSSETVPLLPVYIDEEGMGILRYSHPEGRAVPMVVATGTHTPGGPREFEVYGTLGEWTGPELALCMRYMTQQRLRLTPNVQVYSPTEEAVLARFEFIVDESKAEEIVSTDGGTGPGECDAEFRR